MSKAVFLDRDGVLNAVKIKDGRPYPPSSIQELRILDGVSESLQKLHAAGFLLIVITNQPDVARGTATKQSVEEINQFLFKNLILDEIRVCFHDSRDACRCRKPLPGLILSAVKENNIVLEESYMVGDRWRDIDAGNAAGCKTLYIDNNYSEKKAINFTFKVSSLYEAATLILEKDSL
jgi:D-glycero-D-manno-heptose 1,7-bisphosphate phosphatase